MDVAGTSSVLATAVREQLYAQFKLRFAADQAGGGNLQDAPQAGAELPLPTGDPSSLTPLANPAPSTGDGEEDGQSLARQQLEATQVSYERQERTALKIRTQEGDVIRLRLQTEEFTEFQSITATGDDVIITESALALTSRSRLQISVRGDLNDAELAAIQAVLDQAGSLADQFFAGDLNSAFQTAAGLEIDGQTLARVSLKLGVQEQLALAQAVLGAPAPAPALATPTEPTGGAVATDNVQPVDSSLARQPIAAPVIATPVRTDLAPHAPAVTETAAAIEEPTELAEPTGLGLLDAIQALADMLNAMAAFLSSIVAAFQTESPESTAEQVDGARFRFDLSFKLKVFQAVIGALAETPVAAENTAGLDLLGDTVEAIDAEAQPPLDTLV